MRTPEMQRFLLELADLLERHGVSVEAIEDTRGYQTFCRGIEFTVDGKWDDGNQVREFDQLTVSRYPDPDELRKRAIMEETQ